MTIGIDIRNIGKNRTGDEVVFFNLVKNLSTIDQENHYLLFTDRNPKTDHNLEKALNKLNLGQNFQIVSLGEKGVNKFLWNFWTLPRYIQKNHVDIYHTQYIVPFFIPNETKVVTTIHDVSFKVFPELIRPKDRFFLDLLIPLSLRRANKVLGVSQFTVHEIEKFYSVKPERLDFVYNAVSNSASVLEISSEEKEAVRKKYQLPSKFILYVGTLQPRKNLPLLIEAFSKLTLKDQKINLVIVGGKGNNYDTRIEEAIQKIGIGNRIFFPGFIKEEDKSALISSAEIFCFPSLYEGFGIPILEAMQLKIPVIASDIEPHREIAGEAAIFFDPRSFEDLSEKLEKTLFDNDLRNSLIEKGSKNLKRFSWESSAKKILKIYRSLV